MLNIVPRSMSNNKFKGWTARASGWGRTTDGKFILYLSNLSPVLFFSLI